MIYYTDFKVLMKQERAHNLSFLSRFLPSTVIWLHSSPKNVIALLSMLEKPIFLHCFWALHLTFDQMQNLHNELP